MVVDHPSAETKVSGLTFALMLPTTTGLMETQPTWDAEPLRREARLLRADVQGQSDFSGMVPN
jgi:hypothetical protein